MKSTEAFKNCIKGYLELRAETDELFAVSFAKEGKSIEDCVKYILNTVQASGCNGFADDEIFCMAVHYWDEDVIQTGNVANCKVIVNHLVELSEEEKAEAKEKAMKLAVDEQLKALTSRAKVVKKVVVDAAPSLF